MFNNIRRWLATKLGRLVLFINPDELTTSLGWALFYCNAGQPVRRKDWDEDTYLYLQKDDKYGDYYRKISGQKSIEGWHYLATKDLQSLDWELHRP